MAYSQNSVIYVFITVIYDGMTLVTQLSQLYMDTIRYMIIFSKVPAYMYRELENSFHLCHSVFPANANEYANVLDLLNSDGKIQNPQNEIRNIIAVSDARAFKNTHGYGVVN